MQRTLSLDVYDHTGHSLCSLYDSTNDMVGQATDVDGEGRVFVL